jgi:predicted amidohydrolase YtcJ
MRSLLLASALLLGACAARGDTVDLLLTNGTIYTGDPSDPFVEHLAIDGGRIVQGGDPEETLDLGGRFACIGLVDSHAHMASLGRTRRSLDLVGTSSYEEILLL